MQKVVIEFVKLVKADSGETENGHFSYNSLVLTFHDFAESPHVGF